MAVESNNLCNEGNELCDDEKYKSADGNQEHYEKIAKIYMTRFARKFGVSDSNYTWCVALIDPTAKEQTLRKTLVNDT